MSKPKTTAAKGAAPKPETTTSGNAKTAKPVKTIDAPEPNIIFAAGDHARREPVPFIIDGEDKIKLPAASEQVVEGAPVPFYHEQAARIVAISNGRLYKHFTGKGEKK